VRARDKATQNSALPQNVARARHRALPLPQGRGNPFLDLPLHGVRPKGRTTLFSPLRPPQGGTDILQKQKQDAFCKLHKRPVGEKNTAAAAHPTPNRKNASTANYPALASILLLTAFPACAEGTCPPVSLKGYAAPRGGLSRHKRYPPTGYPPFIPRSAPRPLTLPCAQVKCDHAGKASCPFSEGTPPHDALPKCDRQGTEGKAAPGRAKTTPPTH